MIANAPYIESCVYDYFSTPIINEYIINTSKNEDCIDDNTLFFLNAYKDREYQTSSTEEIIDKETYEQKYFDLSSQIEQLQKQRESLQESAETESTMKKRIAEFRRTLEENEVLDTFDRYVFESIVEKVIVGGYDEDGNKDPAMLTFIYKTGFKNSLDGTNFKPPRKNSKAAKQNAGLCSHTTDEAKSMCSYHSDDTY